MASPPLPEAGAELRALQGKVEVLEAELGCCRSQLEQVQRLLRHTERLYREAQESNGALQTQVPTPSQAAASPSPPHSPSLPLSPGHALPSPLGLLPFPRWRGPLLSSQTPHQSLSIQGFPSEIRVCMPSLMLPLALDRLWALLASHVAELFSSAAAPDNHKL